MEENGLDRQRRDLDPVVKVQVEMGYYEQKYNRKTGDTEGW